MNLGNLLQGVGIFVCIGAVLLVVLGVIAFRRAFASRPTRPSYRENDPLARDQGQERPRFDDEEIESRGGFGNAPSQRGSGFGNRPSGYVRDNNQDRISRRRSAGTRSQDDDDIHSRGGFGG